MISNKDALDLFESGTVSEIFSTYLKKKGFKNEEINTFLLKSKQIHECLSKQKKDIGMLVGKVQSGKTTVFSAVISRYFDKGYDLCIILTSLENVLHDQTYERMNAVFKAKEPSKIDIFNCDSFLLRNSYKRLEKIKDDFKNNHKYIVTILKNKQIEKINEVLVQHKLWKNRKILIIDDEADLASTGSNYIEENRYANFAIKNLLESLSNYNYLSVTATPQAQVLLGDDDAVKPKHVFTYDPGKGYMGIEEFFNDESFFTFVDGDEWTEKQIEIIPESLKIAIIQYFINISQMILDKGFISSTTMLIHTSVAIEDHYKLMRLLIKYKENLLRMLNLDEKNLDYELTIKQFKEVFDQTNLENIIWDDDYVKLIKKIIEYTNINIINSNSDDVIIENINNIVLGSKKVERGVTMENLLVTYITNYHDGVTAVDTVLQRARWFGYREGIRKYIKIYITKDLFKQYKEYILPSENELWQRLKEAEANDNFREFQKYISLNGRSAPTNKVKTIRSSGEKILFYDSSVERDLEIERNAKSIYLYFAKQQRSIINIVGRSYTGIIGLKFLDFCEQIKENKIYETIGIDQYFWQEIRKKADNYPFCLLFFDDNGKDDFRERTPENGKYQLFEGSNEETNFPGEQALYRVEGLHDKIVICLHKIRDKLDNKLRYYVSLHLPKDNVFMGKFYVND